MSETTKQELIDQLGEVMRLNGVPGESLRAGTFFPLIADDGSRAMRMQLWHMQGEDRKSVVFLARNGVEPSDVAFELYDLMKAEKGVGWTKCVVTRDGGVATAEFEYPDT